MKHPYIIDGKPVREQLWPFNPNHGAGRTKMFGVWEGGEVSYEHLGPWRQELRIERWERPRKKSENKSRNNEAQNDIDRNQDRSPSVPSRLPASMPPTYQHFLICPRCEIKVTKLFMVLCTIQEVADAELAEGWIKRNDARHEESRQPKSPEYFRLRAKLIDRYGLLFRSRRLVCRTCLGMRYGQVRKESRREDTYYRDKVRRDEARGYETNLPR